MAANKIQKTVSYFGYRTANNPILYMEMTEKFLFSTIYSKKRSNFYIIYIYFFIYSGSIFHDLAKTIFFSHYRLHAGHNVK